MTITRGDSAANTVPPLTHVGGDRRRLWIIVAYPVLQRIPIPAQVPPTLQPEALGFLKLQSIILLLALLIIAGIVANSYLHPTPDAIRQAQMQHSLERMQLWHNIGQIALPSAVGLLLLALAGGVRWVWRWSGRPTLLRAEDGLYPVAVWDRSTAKDRMNGKRRVLAHNANTAIASTLSITAEPDGQISVDSDTPDNRHADQIAVVQSALSVQRTLAAASALKAPRESVAQIKERHGYYDNPPKPKQAQVIQPLAALPSPTVPEASATGSPPPSLVGAIQKISTPTRFVLGYRYDSQNKLTPAIWDTYADSLLLILGKSRRGKTSSVGITIGLQMAWHGWQTMILDPEEEQTWSVLAPHLDHRETDTDNVVGHVDAYIDEWQRRGELLAAHGVNDVRKLPDSVRPPNAALVIEEYGKLRRGVLGSHGKATLQHLDDSISNIVKVGAKRLMRLVIVDQVNADDLPWPDALRRQGKKLSFTQEVNDHSLVGYHDLMGLGVGEFAFEGFRWQGFHAEPIVAQVMAKAPAGRSHPVPILSAGNVRSTASTGGGTFVPSVPSVPVPGQYGWIGGGAEAGNVGNDTPPPEIVLRSNEEVARLWLAQYADSDLPRGWSTRLAQAIAVHNNDLPNWETAYKSEAARWKERYHPSGKEYTTYQPADGWPKPKGFAGLPQPASTPVSQTDIFGHNLTVLDTANPADAAELERIRAEIAAGNFSL